MFLKCWPVNVLWMAQLGAISSLTLDEVYDSVFDYNDCLPG